MGSTGRYASDFVDPPQRKPIDAARKTQAFRRVLLSDCEQRADNRQEESDHPLPMEQVELDAGPRELCGPVSLVATPDDDNHVSDQKRKRVAPLAAHALTPYHTPGVILSVRRTTRITPHRVMLTPNDAALRTLRMKYKAASSAHGACVEALAGARRRGEQPSQELVEQEAKASRALERGPRRASRSDGAGSWLLNLTSAKPPKQISLRAAPRPLVRVRSARGAVRRLRLAGKADRARLGNRASD